MREELLTAAKEIDLVRSGLDETMRNAFQEIREILESKKEISDFRTSAYIVAVQKIAKSHIEMGI